MEDIEIYSHDIYNPTIVSPNSPHVIQLYQTRESLLDAESYQNFLHNAVSEFRKTRRYTNYKGFLYNLGLDRCQFHSNLTADMVTLEMHHNMLTVYDIALIITEHILNTYGYVTTFDVIAELKRVHSEHQVQLVMLSKTPHQLYHDNPEFFIHPSMCIGDWATFLKQHSQGLTQDLSFKILFYLNEAIEKGGSDDNDLLSLRDEIMDWSGLNDIQPCK